MVHSIYVREVGLLEEGSYVKLDREAEDFEDDILSHNLDCDYYCYVPRGRDNESSKPLKDILEKYNHLRLRLRNLDGLSEVCAWSAYLKSLSHRSHQDFLVDTSTKPYKVQGGDPNYALVPALPRACATQALGERGKNQAFQRLFVQVGPERPDGVQPFTETVVDEEHGFSESGAIFGEVSRVAVTFAAEE